MRLLNTTTLQLHEFFGKVPGYAILSHSWEKEEVTFQDLTVRREAAKEMMAKAYDYEYVWVDTCCIDKSSSAELSEAARPSSSILIIVVD
jgi:hypothetical protein